jgi:hypothetical protein
MNRTATIRARVEPRLKKDVETLHFTLVPRESDADTLSKLAYIYQF